MCCFRCNSNNSYNYGYNANYFSSGTYGNKLSNPGMETSFTSENGRKNWETSDGVEQTSIPSLVHTGNYAAFLTEGSTMSQTMFRVYPSRQYDFSFFAKYGDTRQGKGKDNDKDSGKDNDKGQEGKDGDSGESKKGPNHIEDLGLTATVTYVNRNMQYDVQEINIPAGSLSNDYVYYRALAPATPPDVVAAIVRFNVSDAQIRPHVPHHLGVLIDDVSFTRR